MELDYIVAVPRMAHYIQCSTDIYQVYLKYVEEKDIHVYSIDEVFIDITEYMDFYKMSARELAGKIVRDVQKTTGIVTTVGIGTNLYLAKVAMDIVAKHTEPDYAPCMINQQFCVDAKHLVKQLFTVELSLFAKRTSRNISHSIQSMFCSIKGRSKRIFMGGAYLNTHM